MVPLPGEYIVKSEQNGLFCLEIVKSVLPKCSKLFIILWDQYTWKSFRWVLQMVVLFHLDSSVLKCTHEFCFVDTGNWVSCQMDFSGLIFVLLKAKGPEIIFSHYFMLKASQASFTRRGHSRQFGWFLGNLLTIFFLQVFCTTPSTARRIKLFSWLPKNFSVERHRVLMLYNLYLKSLLLWSCVKNTIMWSCNQCDLFVELL